jgi:hypothetical protein
LNIDTLVISCDEPQLARCLASLRSQTVRPLYQSHINGIIPEAAAFQRALLVIGNNWTLHLGGDTIPYKNAVETASSIASQETNDKICAFSFGLYDTFLRINIGYCHLFNPQVYRSVFYRNLLDSDHQMNKALRARGWILRKYPNVIIGTHFDKPDEFQVFSRCYCQSKKFPQDETMTDHMKRAYENTQDPLYLIGIAAIKFSRKSEPYYGSHNAEYNRKMYERFKNENNSPIEVV